MTDPRVQEDKDYVSSGYAETAVRAEQVFVPRSHMHVLDNQQKSEVIRETYRLLAIAVFSAMAVGWFASRSLPVVQFMSSGPGWILAMLGLNMVPRMALSSARSNSRNAAMLLAGHGAFAGVCLSPLVFAAMILSGFGSQAPNLVQSALVITAGIFLGVSGYIYQSGVNFNYGKGLGAGLAWGALAGIGVSFWYPIGNTGEILILGAIGILGTLQLLWATSSVLRDPDFKDPVGAALMLFAGLFNLFQIVLSLLLRSRR